MYAFVYERMFTSPLFFFFAWLAKLSRDAHTVEWDKRIESGECKMDMEILSLNYFTKCMRFI